MTKARDLANIISGGFTADDIPSLDTAKITTGQFPDARIADLDATKLTGTITPSDSTVSLAKLTATGTKDATTFLRGDNTFAEAGGGKLLQVVTSTVESQQETTSSTFVDITGLSVSITPSSTSSKIFVICNTTGAGSDINAASRYTLLRNGTNLATNNHFGHLYGVNNIGALISMSILDSPSTTSSTTYKAQMRRSSASGTAYSGLNNCFAHITVFEIGA